LSALFSNIGGYYNTANGQYALYANTSGYSNAAHGASTLQNNTTGFNNTAAGTFALYRNTTGNLNTATGTYALQSNTTGFGNTANGVQSLNNNTTGVHNIAVGSNSLSNVTTGQNNIAVGFNAGVNLTTGNSNIDIGSPGIAAEASTIRLGIQGTQTATYIAGITGSNVTGPDVVISAAGRLGVVSSSARYKKDISDMGESTDGLMKLRPVTFRYKSDEQGIKQYGLVAEEVETVYPELVVHDADGKVESVRYSMLTSMLLNELQKQTKKNELQGELLQRQTKRNEQQAEKLSQLEARLAKLELAIASRDSSRNLATAYNR
jgi:hypothetical protein